MQILPQFARTVLLWIKQDRFDFAWPWRIVIGTGMTVTRGYLFSSSIK